MDTKPPRLPPTDGMTAFLVVRAAFSRPAAWSRGRSTDGD